jgi:hypothetical protein
MDYQNNAIPFTQTKYTQQSYIYFENKEREKTYDNNNKSNQFYLTLKARINTILKNPNIFIEWKHEDEQIKYVFSDSLKYCDQSHRIVIKFGDLHVGDEINMREGLSVWGHNRNYQPTWCNQFARDLTKEMYGTYIIGSLSANNLFDSLSKSNDFVSLMAVKNTTTINNENGEYKIWQNYVDKGFLVFYSKKNSGNSGHIEICFPNRISGNKTYQKRHNDDIRYPEENKPIRPKTNIDLFIGAGSDVGYKTQTEKWRTNATPFLYLGFLKIEIN